MKKNNVHGILLLDKPKGITSNKALQKIKNDRFNSAFMASDNNFSGFFVASRWYL